MLVVVVVVLRLFMLLLESVTVCLFVCFACAGFFCFFFVGLIRLLKLCMCGGDVVGFFLVVFSHLLNWEARGIVQVKALWNNLSVQYCFLMNTLYNYHVLFVVQKGSAMIL